jgi:hypothetical protein
MAARDDDCDLPANQIGRQCRQSIELVVGEAIVDGHILALDIAGVSKSLVKSTHQLRYSIERCRLEEADHRHRRLLRAPRAATLPRRRAA